MCFSGTCPREYEFGPRHGECRGGTNLPCRIEHCDSCGRELDPNENGLCERCMEAQGEYD
jgi:hypothetical protein